MSQARRMRRQQAREQNKAPVPDKSASARLAALSDDQFSGIKAEVERYGQEAYEQGYKLGLMAGYAQGVDYGHKKGYDQGLEAGNKMSVNGLYMIVAVALKCIKDDWGKFAFKKKNWRLYFFANALAQRLTEYYEEGLEDKEKQAELQQILLDSDFVEEFEQNEGGQEGAGRSENSP